MEGARPARVEDLPRLAELAALAWEEAADLRGGPALLAGRTPESVGRDLAGCLDARDATVWAGTIDDAVMGLAAGRVVERGPERTGRVELIYVEAGARGVGVGEALLDGLAGWFRAAGCGAMDAVALPGNRDAKQFFEEGGLVARLIVMRRSLG